MSQKEIYINTGDYPAKPGKRRGKRDRYLVYTEVNDFGINLITNHSGCVALVPAQLVPYLTKSDSDLTYLSKIDSPKTASYLKKTGFYLKKRDIACSCVRRDSDKYISGEIVFKVAVDRAKAMLNLLERQPVPEMPARDLQEMVPHWAIEHEDLVNHILDIPSRKK